jgi:hypothetical protein
VNKVATGVQDQEAEPSSFVAAGWLGTELFLRMVRGERAVLAAAVVVVVVQEAVSICCSKAR